MSRPSLYLTARDFDAYAPEKATSNAYARPRLEVKQRALAWARGVEARLAEQGIAVDVHGSDEHPTLRNKKRVDCQWVFFWRDEAARGELERLLDQGRSISEVIDDPSPYTRHAFLALRLDAASVEVCFAVHPDAKVDVDNLEAVPWTDLTEQLRRLPEEFSIGTREGQRTACSVATHEMVSSILGRAAAGQEPFWIGWSVPRDTALQHADTLSEQLEDAIVALGPIYRLVAWAKDNDRIALEKTLESAEQERARTHAEVEAQTQRWQAEKDAEKLRSLELSRERSKPTLGSLFKTSSSSGPQLKARRDVEPAKKAPEARAHEGTAGAAPPKSATPAAPAVVEKGAQVRVLRGAFADKIGVVGELDGRGAARVLLGLLSTRLDVGDLEVIQGKDRGPLQSTGSAQSPMQSSHRRPLAPASRKAR